MTLTLQELTNARGLFNRLFPKGLTQQVVLVVIGDTITTLAILLSGDVVESPSATGHHGYISANSVLDYASCRKRRVWP